MLPSSPHPPPHPPQPAAPGPRCGGHQHPLPCPPQVSGWWGDRGLERTMPPGCLDGVTGAQEAWRRAGLAMGPAPLWTGPSPAGSSHEGAASRCFHPDPARPPAECDPVGPPGPSHGALVSLAWSAFGHLEHCPQLKTRGPGAVKARSGSTCSHPSKQHLPLQLHHAWPSGFPSGAHTSPPRPPTRSSSSSAASIPQAAGHRPPGTWAPPAPLGDVWERVGDTVHEAVETGPRPQHAPCRPGLTAPPPQASGQVGEPEALPAEHLEPKGPRLHQVRGCSDPGTRPFSFPAQRQGPLLSQAVEAKAPAGGHSVPGDPLAQLPDTPAHLHQHRLAELLSVDDFNSHLLARDTVDPQLHQACGVEKPLRPQPGPNQHGPPCFPPTPPPHPCSWPLIWALSPAPTPIGPAHLLQDAPSPRLPAHAP